MEQVEYSGVTINYTVMRKMNKNLYARLDKDGVVTVTAPYLTSKRTIEKFAIESYFKLIKKIKKKEKKIVDEGGKIRVLGNVYDINEVDNLDYLLTQKLKEYLQSNYLDICRVMQITSIPKVVFKRVKGYLGEYNKKRHEIVLNILIGHLDEECIKYILVHELAHTRYMNHQDGFWKEVEEYLPNYRKIRLRCKKEFVYYESY